MTVGLGVDAVEIERFREVLARTPSVEGRLFTEAEREYAARAHDPVPRLAVRFAAKEAVLKAMGVGIGACSWHDIEVARDDDSGQPSLLISGRAQVLAVDRGIARWLLSLTHTDQTATAVAIAE